MPRYSVKVFPGVRVYGGHSGPRKPTPPQTPSVNAAVALIGWVLMMTFVIWGAVTQHSLTLGFAGATGVTIGALYWLGNAE